MTNVLKVTIAVDLGRKATKQTNKSTGAVEDDQHFFIECSKFIVYRNSLVQTVNSTNKKIINQDNLQKFFWLLTN